MFKNQKYTYITKHELKNKEKRIKSKHSASKKGHKHNHVLSLGELNHLNFLLGKATDIN